MPMLSPLPFGGVSAAAAERASSDNMVPFDYCVGCVLCIDLFGIEFFAAVVIFGLVLHWLKSVNLYEFLRTLSKLLTRSAIKMEDFRHETRDR